MWFSVLLSYTGKVCLEHVLQLITGRGELGQGGLYTGLSRPAVQALVFGIVSCNYLAAVNPR